jgi:uncharacterized membrane protein
MYQIISLIVAVVGVVLFFAPDNILDKNNAQLKMIREYHQIVGAGLVAFAYYLYTSNVKSKEISTSVESTTTPSESSSPVPPSYEEATSE